METLAYRHRVEVPARVPAGGRAGAQGREEDEAVFHLTSIDNVVDGRVRNPAMVKHGVIDAKRIEDLSWWIDPATHLNLDFPDHLLSEVFVASRLENGARILGDANRFMYAPVDQVAYRHLGKVEPVERRRRISLRAGVPG
ncbi:MAG TPA: hypothetical protein VKO45_02780 [Methanomicrobiales archaeon]|nr:hypothetical protein [Methanomicrobiales archaeon]